MSSLTNLGKRRYEVLRDSTYDTVNGTANITSGWVDGGGFYVGGSHNSFTETTGYIFTPFSTATTFSTKMYGFFAAGIGLCNGRQVAVSFGTWFNVPR